MAPISARASRPENRPIIRLFQAIDVCYARIYHRLEVLSRPHLPRTGAAILASNHISGLDPLLIQSVCPRLIVWMVAKEYYELAALRWLFQLIEAIPVDRSGRDAAAARAALRALSAGRILGVFPEGRLEPTRELLPFQTGVAMMAMRTGVPVYPVYIDGTQRGRPGMLPAFLYPQRSSVAFGPAIQFAESDKNASLEAATAVIRDSVRALQHLGTSRGAQSFRPRVKKGDKFDL